MFDFYYLDQVHQFTFYQLPKELLSSPRFKTLTMNAKVLYCVLRNRVSLSEQNRWIDEHGRIFIHFPNKDIAAAMGCAVRTVASNMAELEEYGLVLRGSQSGYANRIYVMNFDVEINDEIRKGGTDRGLQIVNPTPEHVNPKNKKVDKSVNPKSRHLGSEVDKVDGFHRSVNPANNGGGLQTVNPTLKSVNPESKKVDKSVNLPSKTVNPEVDKVDRVDKSVNPCKVFMGLQSVNPCKVFMGGMKNFHGAIEKTEKEDISERDVYSSILSYQSLEGARATKDVDNLSQSEGMDGMDDARSQVEVQLDYAELVEDLPDKKALLDNIVDLITDIRADRSRKQFSVARRMRSVGEIQERFARLRKEHVEYVLESMAETTTRIKNIRSYLLTSLYNAPATYSYYYAQRAAAERAAQRDDRDGVVYRAEPVRQQRSGGLFTASMRDYGYVSREELYSEEST